MGGGNPSLLRVRNYPGREISPVRVGTLLPVAGFRAGFASAFLLADALKLSCVVSAPELVTVVTNMNR